MTQKFTVEEVRACLAEFSDDVAFPREEIDIEKVRTMLTAYADTLSKPADSGWVGDVAMLNCPDCLGSGERCLAGCSAHDSNWYKCKRCAGTGKVPQPPEAALAAQGQGEAVAEVYEGAFDTHYIACADPNKLPVGTKLYTAPPASPAGVLDGWADAYAAFKGAFDTPAAWLKDNSEYANDARKRLREFNEAMKAQQPTQRAEGE